MRDAFRALTAAFRLSVVLVSLSLVMASNVSAASGPEITGQYAVVVDADTGAILFDKSMNTPAAPASLTKIFTASYALQAAPLSRTLTVDQFDLVGESSMGLRAGETVSLKTALYGMLLPSGNDAAMTIAQNLGAVPGDTPQQSVNRFVGWVNDMASRFGLTETHLVNPDGLDQTGHTTSAHDVAAITMYALKNPEFRKIIGTAEYTGDGHVMYQANRLLGVYSGLIGGKTGITDNAGYCLVEVAQRGGHTIIAVVMKSTATAWYQDASSLLDYGFSALAAGQTVSGDAPITLSPEIVDPSAQAGFLPSQFAVTPVSSSAATTRLSVHQVSENVAVVSHNLLGSTAQGFSWKWPLFSFATMLAMLAVALNYPLVIGAGSLLWRHGLPSGRAQPTKATELNESFKKPARSLRAGRRRNSRRGPRPTPDHAPNVSALAAQPMADDQSSFAQAGNWQNVVSLNAAETIGTRAVRLALRGDYHAASGEFVRALKADSTFDLTRCAGFWSMQPAGYVAAARAYALHDRTSDARSLLTVIKLSCGTHRELERLLKQVVIPAVH